MTKPQKPPGEWDRVATRAAEMAALDALPRELRLLIKFGPYRANPLDYAAALKAGRSMAWCVNMIRSVFRATPTVLAREWEKLHLGEYPHFAARATILWTEPDDTPGNARERLAARRRVARLRMPAPAPMRQPERAPLPDVILL